MLKKQSSPHLVSRTGRVVLKRGAICPQWRNLRVALLLTAFALSCPLTTLHAADTGATPVQEAGRIFAPLAYPDAPNGYRSGSGRRGPQAWQNRADYDIRVTIDPTNRTLSGSEIITYTNNSPDPLDVLWVQLDQNIYREGSRADFANPEWHEHHTDGIAIESVSIEDEGRSTPLVPVISDTRMQLELADPMQKGEKRKIRIVWHYTVPGEWGGRTAVSSSRNGDIYEIAQFYPRMAVYDDIRGWDAAPYLGQEFYLEYGDFDYSVTVPSRFVVAGSGALVNPSEVLTQEQRDRLAQAAKSEQRVMIRTQAEVEAPPLPLPRPEASPSKKGSEPDKKAEAPEPATRTWHFRMANTRDVAFMASPAFLWDAAKLDLPPLSTGNEKDKQPAPRLAMSFYPVEGIGAHGWDRSTAYVKHAIEYFSSQWSPYPWPNAINAAGHGASMEYPGIAFEDVKKRDPDLFAMTTHELGHQWFPMVVGSNERRHAFMDEGFNTFIDTLAAIHFNGGEFAPKRDAEYAPQTGRPAIDIVPLLRDRDAPVLMAPSDTVSETYRHDLTYFKSAYGLTLLREQILGPDRFDRALRAYIKEWSFHHPTPSDFFRFMNSETGEDLSWFWRGWYFNNWAVDYAVGPVSYAGNDPKNGAVIPVINKGRLPLPVVLQVTWMDGSSARIRIPTETWMLRSQLNVQVAGTQPVRTAILDPDKAIPDIDRSNNSFGEIPTAFPTATGH